MKAKDKKSSQASPPNSISRTGSDYLYIALLVIITLITFWQVGSLGFTNWDDDKYVTGAHLIKSFSLTEAFATPTVGLYTPLTTLSYMIDYQLFDLNAKAYHLENLFLHIICCLLVYRLSILLLKEPIAAFMTAALFAVHPLHVEPVAWISSRKDLLFTLLYLLAMIKYLHFLDKGKKTDYWLCFLLFLLGCLAKPTAVSLPLVLVVLEWFRSGKIALPNWKRIAPMLAISIAIGVVTILVTKNLGLRPIPDEGYSTWQIIHFAAYGLGFYIIKLFWPAGLANYHAYPLPDMDLPWDYLIAPWIVLALFGFIWLSWKREPRVLFAVLISLLILAPNYRFVPIGFPMVADRYGYLSSLGLMLVVGLVIGGALKKPSLKLPILIVMVFLVTLLARSSFMQAQTWKNSLSMWNNTVDLYPFAYYPLQKRGEAYLEKGHKVKALQDYMVSLSLMPVNPALANSASLILFDMGKMEEALSYQNLAVQYDSSAAHLYNRGNTYKAIENYEKAIENYNYSIVLDPNLGSAYNNRGVCKIITADTLGAHNDFFQAVKLEPGNIMFSENLNKLKELITEH